MRRHRPPREAFLAALLLFSTCETLAASDPARVAATWRSRAQIRLERGEYAASREAALQALDAARRTGDPRLIGYCLDDLGNACFYLIDYAQALAHFAAGLAQMRLAGDRAGEALLLRDLGITEMALDLPDRALAHLLAAVEAYAEADPEGPPGAVYANLGSLYASLGADRLALATLDRAMEVAQRRRSPALLIDVATRLGTLELDLQRPEAARARLESAYAAVADQVELVQRAWLLEFLAVAREHCGDPDGAAAAYREVLAIDRRLGNEPLVQWALIGLGNLELDRDPEAATRLFLEALAVPARPWRWRAQAGLARLQRRRGDLRGALELDRQALDAFEERRRDLAFAGARRRQTVAARPVAEALVADLLDLDAGRGDPLLLEAALAASERLREPELRDALAADRLGLPAELQEERRGLEARARALRRRLLAHPGPEKRSALAREVERTELELDLLHGPGRALDRTALKTIELDALRRALPADSALLAYWVAPEETVVFVVTGDGLGVERLPLSQSELAARVDNAIELIAQDRRRGWEPTLARLHRDLLVPVRHLLPRGTRRLIVVPDGPLMPLPFEALVVEVGPGRPRFLVEELAVSYAPSATVFARLSARAARRGPAARPLAVLAEPLLGAAAPASPAATTRLLYEEEGLELRPLVHVAREAAAVGRFAGRGSTVLTGAAASEAWLKAAPLERYGVLHFATHSILSRWAPARSAVVLSAGPASVEDGFLQVREVRRLRLRSDLVVLAACRTGRSESLRPREAEGLATAFLEAGADSVLASLSALGDAAAADLADHFYRHLARGTTKVDALRAAKLELLSRPPRMWAPLVLVGEPVGEVHLRARTDWRGPALGGIAVAFGVLALVCARGRARRRRRFPVDSRSRRCRMPLS